MILALVLSSVLVATLLESSETLRLDSESTCSTSGSGFLEQAAGLVNLPDLVASGRKSPHLMLLIKLHSSRSGAA